MIFGTHSLYRQNLESLSIAAKVMTDFYQTLEQRATRLNCRMYYGKAAFEFTMMQHEVDALFDLHMSSSYIPFAEFGSANHAVKQNHTLSETVVEISQSTAKILRVYKADWLEEFVDDLELIHEHLRFSLERVSDSASDSSELAGHFDELRARVCAVTTKLSDSLYSTNHVVNHSELSSANSAMGGTFTHQARSA